MKKRNVVKDAAHNDERNSYDTFKWQNSLWKYKLVKIDIERGND